MLESSDHNTESLTENHRSAKCWKRCHIPSTLKNPVGHSLGVETFYVHRLDKAEMLLLGRQTLTINQYNFDPIKDFFRTNHKDRFI